MEQELNKTEKVSLSEMLVERIFVQWLRERGIEFFIGGSRGLNVLRSKLELEIDDYDIFVFVPNLKAISSFFDELRWAGFTEAESYTIKWDTDRVASMKLGNLIHIHAITKTEIYEECKTDFELVKDYVKRHPEMQVLVAGLRGNKVSGSVIFVNLLRLAMHEGAVRESL